LDLLKATYERCGLQGTPIPTLGRKHLKERFLVEANLRAPGMVKGRKGFERLRWAATNVLTEKSTWLFCDVKGTEAQTDAPIEQFQPTWRDVKGEVTELPRVMVPAFPAAWEDTETDRVEAEELLEWLMLVSLNSERVREEDKIDSFLSRYEVPQFGPVNAAAEVQTRDLTRLRYRGFMPSSLVARIFSAGVKEAKEEWFAVLVSGLEEKRVVVLKDRGKALTWEFEG